MRRDELADASCGIAQAMSVLSDWWTVLLVREIASGVRRFEELHRALGMSRRALTEHLGDLTDAAVLERVQYSERPPRFEYELTAKGEALAPVLVALQGWGDRWVGGDGATGLSAVIDSREAERVHGIIGTRLPQLELDGTHNSLPIWEQGSWTVLFCFPGAFVPADNGYPVGWDDIPGAAGCTLETRAFARLADEFRAAGIQVRGLSTQRVDQLQRFSDREQLPFPLLSDPDGRVAVAARLPMFHVAGVERYKRQTLLLDPTGIVAAVQAPIADPGGSAVEILRLALTSAAGGLQSR